MNLQIELDRQALEDFCREYGIVRLAFYGSVLREDFSEDSDIDVLIEWAPWVTNGVCRFNVKRRLAELLGRPLDIHTFEGMSRSRYPKIAHQILDAAEDYYVATV